MTENEALEALRLAVLGDDQPEVDANAVTVEEMAAAWNVSVSTAKRKVNEALARGAIERVLKPVTLIDGRRIHVGAYRKAA